MASRTCLKLVCLCVSGCTTHLRESSEGSEGYEVDRDGLQTKAGDGKTISLFGKYLSDGYL